MILFISVSVIPLSGNIVSNDDTTPPVTTHSLDPETPDGDNGWYISNVTVTLNATDDLSGVKEIRYRIEGGDWQSILGDNGTFLLDVDGDDLLIEYYAIDNAENEGEIKWFIIDIDQASPVAQEPIWETYKEDGIWYLDFTVDAIDATSGMDRVECFIEDEHNETIEGAGPLFVFTFKWSDEFLDKTFYFYHYDRAGNVIICDFRFTPPPPPPPHMLLGIICNREISEKTTSFFAIWVFKINYLRLIVCKHMTVPNNYRGYIGKYFIFATFYDWW